MWTPIEIKKIWHLAFEYSGIVKVGGLAEAVRTMTQALANSGLEVLVLMPSHGVHLNPNRGFDLVPLDFQACGDRIGIDGNKYHYCIGAEIARLGNVNVVLFKGLDTQTGLVFDSRYPYENIEEKASLFTRAVVAFAEKYGLPDLVHVHDWHSVLAGVALKDLGERKGVSIPLVYTIHLSSTRCFPWHYASVDWSGIHDRHHPVWRTWKHEWFRYSDVWDSVYGCVEAFGVLESDLITTVSHGYLEELLGKYGYWLREKSCVIYNAVDWRVEDTINWLLRKYNTANRIDTRWRVVDDVDSYCRDKVGWIEKRGPLFLVIGRLSHQKGIDIALNALKYTNDFRLIVLGTSVGDRGYEFYLNSLVEGLPGRAVIYRCTPPLDYLKALYYVSTATLVPSRWEPFGIVAVESMSMGTPVIASSTGGLGEIVVDLGVNPQDATGILVSTGDIAGFAKAMERLAYLIEIDKESGDKIRNNCIRRVDMLFRSWRIRDMTLSCYEKARLMAFYRAHAGVYK
ncbi:MAG: glycogen/starch synthase [Desulfurococcaceae archaeon]